jgi:hypothetical protein
MPKDDPNLEAARGETMSLLTFRTSQCARYGHPEFTLSFSQQRPVPGLERLLLGYFENGVARGAKFLPGQVVQLGWAALRLIERQDGTLGVQEIDPRNESGWVESVDRSLMETWFQKEVVASLAIEEPAFPGQLQNAIVCKQLLQGGPEYLLSRSEPRDADDSGWFLGCFEQTHDHNSVDNLAIAQLISVAAHLPLSPSS